MDRPLALVTGASSGIGRALARKFAAEGFDLVLVARDEDRLKAVARECESEFGVAARSVGQDLSVAGASQKVREALGGAELDVLVNNAGFGVHGPIAETDARRELEMVRVHVDAVVELTKAFLPGMIRRGKGRILNIGSVYCFAPVPFQAMYAATKAFQLSFSQSLSGELEGTGVTVTLVCPGITRTEFRARAGMKDSSRLKGVEPERVADAAYRAMVQGRRVVVLGGASKLFVGLARLLPGRLFLPLMGAINRYRGLSPAR